MSSIIGDNNKSFSGDLPTGDISKELQTLSFYKNRGRVAFARDKRRTIGDVEK